MTTYELFILGLKTWIQANSLVGETEKDMVRELFDNSAVIYSDKVAKNVIANLDPMYLSATDKHGLSDYAFGDRIHITPKYDWKNYVVTFCGLPSEQVPAIAYNFDTVLAICEPGQPLVKVFNKHYLKFNQGKGVIGRNSVLYAVTP